MTAERGHRSRAHTADVILEAWGPDLASCCEEAVDALVDVYLERRGPTVSDRVLRVPPADPEAMLLAVLDEVIFVLDTVDEVPVAATVEASVDGVLDVVLSLSRRDSVEPTGGVPKAVSRSGLTMDVTPDGARCQFLVDV